VKLESKHKDYRNCF